jgi:lysophospholipase L1-like esterase
MKQFLLLPFLLGFLLVQAQDPSRFDKQIEKLSEKTFDYSTDKKRVVFTGSSSIVRWNTVQEDFPKYDVLNYGFGGSVFSDLIYYYDELILKPKPDILFIYEGDNDVARDKKVKTILKEAKWLYKQIRKDLPQTRIIFISPKPCIANWGKKDNYIKLNKKLQHYCEKQIALEFADVWSAMVDEDGLVFQDIFVEDGDHMNEKGYAIWRKVIGDFL